MGEPIYVDIATLITGLTNFDLQYFDGETEVWNTSWDDQESIPNAVRVLIMVESEIEGAISTNATTQFTPQNQPVVPSNSMTQSTMVYLRASTTAGGGRTSRTLGVEIMAFTKQISDTFHKEQSGLSLVSTLWILTILSVLAAQLLYSIHIEQRTPNGIFWIGQSFTTLQKQDLSGHSPLCARIKRLLIHSVKVGLNLFRGQVDDGVQVGNLLSYQVTVTDESSKVNINTADVGLITNLLAQVGASPDDPLTQELANYIVEGRPYRTVRDLARVEGMTSRILYGTQQGAPSTQGVANTQGASTSTVASVRSFQGNRNRFTTRVSGFSNHLFA